MYNHRINHISLLFGYPEPAATQIRIRGLRPALDGYKLQQQQNNARTQWNYVVTIVTLTLQFWRRS